ncbi:hypothetical protein Arub01_27590 [Actinomadura rubrobrunea]|uniref:LapA family protein n=1 Tax=Actinomadura rubrobrunea TaxID=115335 RepID=A0A9W6PVB9_9ACTN|nr:hypothetical protein [Actinomadura rubrobrunea]GLW64515.1 hypothetical protein Arub01_27590 [Actinomadura rubrobrunea]
MTFLGLLIVVAALVVGAAVIADNTGEAELTAFGEAVPGVSSVWQVFAAGAVVALVLMLGATLALAGIRRAVRLRRELQELRDEHKESIQTLELEKRRLEHELAIARRNAAASRPVEAAVRQP